MQVSWCIGVVYNEDLLDDPAAVQGRRRETDEKVQTGQASRPNKGTSGTQGNLPKAETLETRS